MLAEEQDFKEFRDILVFKVLKDQEDHKVLHQEDPKDQEDHREVADLRVQQVEAV